jgi:hypothetical protein
MPARSRDEAETDLAPFYDAFREAQKAGIGRYWAKLGEDAFFIHKGVRANLCRCNIAYELKQRIEGQPGVRIHEDHQSTMFIFFERWLVKVHKLDEDCLRAINPASQLCMDLVNNDIHMAQLPGLESPTYVILGHVEVMGDRLNPELKLVCPDGRGKPNWIIDLDFGSPPAPIEVFPSDSPNPDGGTRVVVRRKDRKARH